MVKKITISDVAKKQLRIVGYLLVSGALGYGLSLLTERPELTAIFAPIINFILVIIKTELDKEGYIKVLKN